MKNNLFYAIKLMEKGAEQFQFKFCTKPEAPDAIVAVGYSPVEDT